MNNLLSVALFFAIAIRALALPSTGSNNLMTTPGVSISQSGSTLTFTTPDKAILNWNNFGSGTDTIGVADTLKYALPNSGASVLNVVVGANNTTINGYVESNGKVFILNPNGIVIGAGARIDTAGLVLSTVDNPFAAQMKFMENGTIPSQAGSRSASGNTTINSGAILVTPNITVLTNDITIGGVLTGGNLNVVADGAATLGAVGSTTWISGDLVINNAGGTTTLGLPGAIVGANGNVTATAITGNITNAVGSRVNTRNLTVQTETGNITIAATSALNVTAKGKNVSVAFDTTPNVTFNGSATGNLTVTAPTFLTLGNVTGQSSGNYSFTSGATLTLGKVHLDVTGTTSFTGSRVVDSVDSVFVYGPTSFTATAGDVVVTKANHSFGPLSLSATGNATVFEAGATNLNVVNVKELAIKTGQFFFQTPTTFSLAATKFNLTSLGNVTFLGGTITNGLTISAGAGNVDLSKLSLATNLGGVAPTVTTTGTVTQPAQ